ncbi:hypothetical protein [Gemmiger formicilis]|uniref:hypothetical protein n=1 Tax=Gemmiger formicilis TaxID=745368 RepID=UPI0035202B61
MTMIDAALAALETVCSNVSFVKNEDDPLPDSYVVLSVLDDTPEVYAGDLDEQQRLQVRAAWYTRDLPQPCARKMRCALRNAGFIIGSTEYGYDNDTRHFIAYVEAETDDGCDWNEREAQ